MILKMFRVFSRYIPTPSTYSYRPIALVVTSKPETLEILEIWIHVFFWVMWVNFVHSYRWITPLELWTFGSLVGLNKKSCSIVTPSCSIGSGNLKLCYPLMWIWPLPPTFLPPANQTLMPVWGSRTEKLRAINQSFSYPSQRRSWCSHCFLCCHGWEVPINSILLL